MRKLLLASVAALGVTAVMSDAGFAQSADDNSGQAASPAPGTITVRLNGRFRAFGGLVATATPTAPSFTIRPRASRPRSRSEPAAPLAFAAPRQRLSRPWAARSSPAPASRPPSPARRCSTIRTATTRSRNTPGSFPGFDGVAANGLKYGASLEIRQDNASGAGGGVYGSISQQARQRGALYLRREWGYIGTDQMGTVRFGATDGPSGLYMTGNFENFNDGGWNGDVNNFPAPNAQVLWPFADVGALYTTNKVIYLSPQFYGVDFGVAYEPSTANVGLGSSNGCNGSDAIGPAFIPAGGRAMPARDATAWPPPAPPTTPAGATRWMPAYAIVARSARSGSPPTWTISAAARWQNSILPTLTGNRNQFDGLSVGIGGVAVTYAGLTVGGMAQGGRYNGQWNLAPTGSTDSVAWLGGVSYTFGPVVVGTSYYQYHSPGSSGPSGSGFGVAGATNVGFSPLVGQRRERGVAAGGTYSLAPGLALFLSYLWADRKENGFDLLTGPGEHPREPASWARTTTTSTARFSRWAPA